ncbi:hypothetical protein L1S34_13945, partial [Flavobacterium sp. K77]|uniref:MBG domain-containing protein n=1 Tax=Flavobacterium sp. K77 TaxID=2910676 RepID=UPI001F20A131
MSNITHRNLKLIQGFLFIAFFFISLASYSQTPRFTDPTLYSGIDKTVGAKYRYTNVTTVNGTNVDAILSIVRISDATIVDIDNPNNGSGSLRDRFQPVISTRRANGFVEFNFDFYKAGTYGTAQELKIDLSSFTFEALDLDGSEFFDVVRPSNELIILELNSFLTILPNLINQFTRIQGPSNSVDPISISNTRYIAAINYGNVNSLPFRLGNSTQTSNRQSSISFGEVTFSIPTAPIANNDSKLCNTSGAVSIDVTANDVDANRNLNTNSVDLNPTAVGRQTTLSVTNQGNWSVSNTGVVTFTPLATFKGDPTPIKYTISDSTPLVSNEATITITYTPEKPSVSVTSQPTCSVATGTITVSSPIGNGLTYSIDGTNYQNTSGIFTNVAAGTYSVTAKSSSGCISSTTSVTINNQPVTPSAPVSGGNQTVCSDGTTTQTLTATATGGTITWYDASTAGNVVNAPTQVGVGTKTYYAEASNGSCFSLTRTAVTLTITPLPGQPIATNYEYCQDSIAQPLSANASSAGGTLFYFNSLTGTAQTSVTPSTSTAGQFTYYVAEQRNSCFGPKSPITVIVHPKTIITSQPTSKSIVYGNSTSFTVSSSNATAFQWQVNTGSGFNNITNNTIYGNATTSTLTVTNPTVNMNSYLYRVILTGTGNCNLITSNEATLTVTPKTATVVAANKTKVYGDVNPALTATVTGAINGDTINYTLATTATTTSNVGTYPIVVTLGSNPNYTVTKTDANLTVTPKTATVV